MKTKKKWLALAMTVMWVACMAGCGMQTDTSGIGSPSTPKTQQTAEATSQESGSLGERDTQNQKESAQDPPEGYVYDYQASLEPIPQKIADLGGPCVGTMHAFPSRIMVGLMKQRMEEDPEFKQEAEQKTREAKESLHEETGKDFEVEVMWVSEDNFDWRFYCTEQGEDYHFCLRCYNFSLGAKYYTSYYTRMRTKAYGEELREILSQIYGDVPIYLWCHDEIDIYVAQFPEEEINYMEEQARLLELFQALEGLPRYDEELDWHILGYNIYVGYYPPEYKKLITEKYETGVYMDIFFHEKQEQLDELIGRGEVRDVYYGMYHWNSDFFPNGYSILEDYKNGTYDETQKWDDWATGGKENG